MSSEIPSNSLLSTLGHCELELVRPHLEAVDLPVRRRLAEANRTIRHVYFPSNGIASVVHGLPQEASIEIGIVGREGLANVPAVLGADKSPNEVLMQVRGDGQRIEVDRLRAAMDASPILRVVLLRYCSAFLSQVSSTVFANGRANVRERLARWLLMSADREGPQLPLTHEFLSVMLGVRRSSVTLALREFQQLDVVSLQRGSITLRDREELERVANHYYGAAERELLRIFPGS